MRLEDMMTRKFATLRPDDSLKSAISLLRNSQRDGLPVLNKDGSLAGIFTKTNLYDALLKNSPLEHPVRDYYNRDVVKIAKDLTYNEVIDAVRRIPVGTGVVVDREERVVGLFTKVELITALFRLAPFQEELKKARLQERPFTFDDIITIDPATQALIREAQQAAQGLSTVLISGESGVGKELMAQAIHQAGPRRNAPFVKVNCAAIPENLLEADFFGYVQGAFTGASKSGKPGRLDRADGGTLFLDEIGDMPLSLQGKLLRVLQEQAFERVGDTTTIRVDIRFIAATNQDLEEKVRAGSFRKDLFFRLNVIPVPIPPLREKPADILPLVHAFLRKYNDIFGMQVSDISSEALNALRSYSWPGNIRELENVVERAMNFTGEETIRVEHLPPHLRVGFKGHPLTEEKEQQKKPVPPYRWKREEQERESIVKALQQSCGNKSEAARALGMSRSWLYEKMNRLGLK